MSEQITVTLTREEAKILDQGRHIVGGQVLRSARAKLRTALDAPQRFSDSTTQSAPGGEDGDWPEVWLVRSAYTLDPEHYDVWGPAANDTVPHPNEPGEFRRYIPAPDTEEGSGE